MVCDVWLHYAFNWVRLGPFSIALMPLSWKLEPESAALYIGPGGVGKHSCHGKHHVERVLWVVVYDKTYGFLIAQPNLYLLDILLHRIMEKIDDSRYETLTRISIHRLTRNQRFPSHVHAVHRQFVVHLFSPKQSKSIFRFLQWCLKCLRLVKLLLLLFVIDFLFSHSFLLYTACVNDTNTSARKHGS